jgi:enamine deaminase RidA (YjgF/YER057c/UK114 family)
MTEQENKLVNKIIEDNLSAGEEEELLALGILSGTGSVLPFTEASYQDGYARLEKHAMKAENVLNEATCYGSAFARGLRLEMGSYKLLIISGTASVDDEGETVYKGDFRAQCWRTYRNITNLLEAEGGSWKDIVKTTCYLRDIERDYEAFNDVRNAFFEWNKLDPLPASVGIQARLCREDLLVEIEAVAILKKTR